MQELLPLTGKALRVGITGVPGVGKSTTIDALGTLSHRPGPQGRGAGASIRPRPAPAARSSATRPAWRGSPTIRHAFIRPSPSSGTLGGVAAKTRETMLLCEAAGYDVILVETVGIGQSETAVADMTDFFLVLMLPGAGDELQGIKKGVLELADMIAVNKADGDNLPRASAAAAEYGAAFHILQPRSPHWTPPVVTYSALTGDGVADLWQQVVDHRERMRATGDVRRAPRANSRSSGCGRCWSSGCWRGCMTTPHCATRLPALEAAVADGAAVAGAGGGGTGVDCSGCGWRLAERP